MKCQHVCNLDSCVDCEQFNKLQIHLGLKLVIDEKKVIEMNSLTSMSMLTARTLCVFSLYGENRIVSKYDIKNYVWQYPVTDNNLTHTIHKCRSILKDSNTSFDVVNIRGFGYCLMNINFIKGSMS